MPRFAAFVVLLTTGLCTGCSFFSSKAYEAPKPADIEVTPWRIIGRAPPGKPGGTLRVAEFGSGPKTFNPIIANESTSVDIIEQVFSSLLDYNFKTNKIVGGLAYRWEHTPDARVWTVHLRKGLRWSDGIPLTADDVVFTFRAIYDPKVDNPSRDIAQVQGKPIACEKIDELTVQFVLPDTYGPFLYLLGSIPIIPKHKLEGALDRGNFSSAYSVNTPVSDLVSSAGFRIAQYVPQERVVLERNPYFFAKDVKNVRLPYLDRIVVQYVPNINTEYLKFRSGEADFMVFPSQFYDDMLQGEKSGNYHVVNLGQGAGTGFLVFNQNPNPKFLNPIQVHWFSNRVFRLAVAYAFNRDAMIRLAYLGHGYPLSQDFLPSSVFYNPKIKPFPYDPDKSRMLLRSIGYSWKNGKLFDDQGNRVQFALLTNSGTATRRIIGELIKEDLAKIGMEVDFHPIDFNQLVAKLDHTFDWQAVLIGLADTGGSIEPSGNQNVWLSSGYTHEWNPRQKTPATSWEAEIDKLVWEGIRSANVGERKKIYGRIEEILYQEEVPMILTVAPADLYAFRNNIGNADPTPIGRFWVLCPDDMLMDQVYLMP